MDYKVKVKKENIVIGKYDVDSIIIIDDNQKIQICFDKKDNISQYIDKEINILFKDNKYFIQEIANKKPKK